MNASPILMSLGVMEHDPREANAAFIVEACNSHASLKARAEQAERSVDVLESNARVQAKRLADTGRRVEELAARVTVLTTGLSAAAGYLRNADIDLSTGCTKATAQRTIRGGLKVVEAALELPQSRDVARAPTEPSS